MRTRIVLFVVGLALFTAALPLAASSHREAPFVTEHPKVDATDFYMFRSYEPGREAFVTLIANYYPLQDPFGGPNYFDLDPEARYRIHVDQDGDGRTDVGFEFFFDQVLKGIALEVGPDGTSVPVALKNIGEIGIVYPPKDDPNLNLFETYRVDVVRSDGRAPLADADGGATAFAKPADNIGLKSIPDYAAYVADFVYDVTIPGCDPGRLFVGQRTEGFGVNLGEVFDLVNTDPLGDPAGERSATEHKNVTTLALEVPIACLTGDGDGALSPESSVIGGWTSATLPRKRKLLAEPTFEEPAKVTRDDPQQVSRLGMPLVNEVVIGLPDKDRFNASRPADDDQFATYVTNPTLPELLEILFGVEAPNNFPRGDLLAAFVTGIPGINELGFGEMQRLDTAVPATPMAEQESLGVLADDLAGFPNGRRPGDDVVDATLRVAMGALCHAGLGLCEPADAPAGTLPYTDGVAASAEEFQNAFPYLREPIPGSPNSENGVGEL